MAPSKRKGPKPKPSTKGGEPPPPFKKPSEILEGFLHVLDEKHVYVTHIDSKPAALKRKLFIVPIAINVGVVGMFCLRMWWIGPYYFDLVASAFGHPNSTTFPASDATWNELIWEIGIRGLTMFFDFMLFVFLWPWPVQFVYGPQYGSPAAWRWNVGFRDKEVYVRRSRSSWDSVLGDFLEDPESGIILAAHVTHATSPLLQEQKTGYLLMDSYWDLEWDAMIHAHALVDKKYMALEAFKNIVVVHHKDHGWLQYDIKVVETNEEDERRREVFAFRDALTAMGKDDLFYRWVELVQFESTQTGGFGPEKQEATAKKIRDMFKEQNIDFDNVWKEAVGKGDEVFDEMADM